MVEANFFTLLVVLLFAAVLVYRISLFREKSIGYFSLLQIIYLIVIPGFVLPMLFTYLQAITARPLNAQTFMPDAVLINVILLSVLFTYGGVAVHSVTKMLSDTAIRHDSSDIGKMNRFFHLTFSHNLIYGGCGLTLASLVLLEVNHVPSNQVFNVYWALGKGLLLGLSFILAMFFYTKSNDNYRGRWSDLKFLFLIMWLLFLTLIYGIHRIDPQLSAYQLLLPTLLSFSMVAFFNFALVIRKLKNGRYKVWISQKRLKKLLAQEESA